MWSGLSRLDALLLAHLEIGLKRVGELRLDHPDRRSLEIDEILHLQDSPMEHAFAVALYAGAVAFDLDYE